VVRAFADDSGSGGDSRYYVLAGVLADLPTWEKFADQWEAALGKPPRLEYFKMADAESLRSDGPFADFTEAQRDRRVNDLIDVILGHDLFEGSCHLSQADYDQILKPILEVQPDWDDPYLFLFTNLVTLFAGYERRFGAATRGVPKNQLVVISEDATIASGCGPQVVDYVFDNQGKVTERRARRLYRQFCVHPMNEQAANLGNVDFRDDRDFEPLQAADLTAWQHRRRLCLVSREGTRSEYTRLHENPSRFFHHEIGRAELQKQADSIRRAAQLRAAGSAG
jgi:hypothetical protein